MSSVRTFVSLMIGVAVLATAVVSVRLHLLVVGQRYALASLMDEHDRADRALRRANADLEALKAPRKLMDRWAEMQGTEAPARSAAMRPVPPVVPLELEVEDPEPTTSAALAEGAPAGPSPDPANAGATNAADAPEASDALPPETGPETSERGGAR